jgi:hypothetical protein
MVPRLQALGVEVKDVIEVTNPNSASEVGKEASDISAAVLRLRADGVTHVLLFESAGNVAFFFLKEANGQRYFPRYGFTSQNAIQVLLAAGDAPAEQLSGAKGLGWWPVLDLEHAPATGPYSNDNRRRCDAIMKGAGLAASEASAEFNSLAFCSQVLLLQAALVRSGRLDAAGFLAGLNALGTSFHSPATLITSFGPRKHNGAGGYLYYSFDSRCTCFRYSGRPHPLSS